MSDARNRPNANVIDMFTGKPLREAQRERFIRISPELDGLDSRFNGAVR